MTARRYKVLVCKGPTCGQIHQSPRLRRVLESAVDAAGLQQLVEVGWQSCFGRCSQGPNALVREVASGPQEPQRLAALPMPGKGRAALYSGLVETDMIDIVKEHLVGGRIVRRLVIARPKSASPDASQPREHKLPQVLSSVLSRPRGDKS